MPHAFCYLIETYAKEPDSAQYYFDKATSLVPSWTYPYDLLGRIYFTRNELDKAEETLLQGLQLDSNSAILKIPLAAVYMDKEKYDLAESLLEEVLDKRPPGTCMPCTLSLLASIYEKEGRRDESFALFREAIALDSTSANLHNSVGWAYLLLDSFAIAEKYFLKAISLDSMISLARPNLGIIYAKTGRFAEAEKMFQKGLEEDPDSSHIYVNYAILYSKQNLPDKAFNSLEQALEKGFLRIPVRIDIKQDSDLAILREQKERWDTLMKKYAPNQSKD